MNNNSHLFIYMEHRKLCRIVAFCEAIKNRGNKILLIADENIASIYFEFIKQMGFPCLIIPAGEKEKSRERKAAIEDHLLENGYGRDTELIAFGGGVISDLVGFVAATFMRGVRFSIIPTTVTCFVDASIGGKNGINTSMGKNLIGTFYAPIDVCLDQVFLKTLPKNLYEEQFSEVIKIALTSDKELFFSMENPILRARELKMQLVEKDPMDTNARAILNFGHTFAHAYEKVSDYKVSHAKAVLVGIYFESLLSYGLDILKEGEWRIIQRYLLSYPQKIFPLDLDIEAIYRAMCLDKKNKEGNPCFILLRKIGSIHQIQDKITHQVARELIIETLEKMCKEEECFVG